MKEMSLIDWGFFILSLATLWCLIKIIYDAKMEGKRNEEFFRTFLERNSDDNKKKE